MPYLTPDTIPTERVCRTLKIPADLDIVGAVSGALLELTKPYNWEQFGAVTPDEIAQEMVVMLNDYLESECEAGSMLEIDIFYQRANQGVNGGAISANTQTPIPFGTNGQFNAGNVSHGANGFTVQPGLYDIELFHKITPSSSYINCYMGLNGSFSGLDDNQIGYAIGTNLMALSIRRLLNAEEVTVVQFWCQHGTAVGNTFFGAAKNRAGFLEMYGWVQFTRIGDPL